MIDQNGFGRSGRAPVRRRSLAAAVLSSCSAHGFAHEPLPGVNEMKKLIALALCVFALTATVVGCTGASSSAGGVKNTGK